MRISARNQLKGTVESVQSGEVMAETVVKLSGGSSQSWVRVPSLALLSRKMSSY